LIVINPFFRRTDDIVPSFILCCKVITAQDGMLGIPELSGSDTIAACAANKFVSAL
jgi:hypothetical protein